jgi:cellulose synthase/poly-beta-1,6-N-acetylglucosamine synthase-like glycosyltransferase
MDLMSMLTEEMVFNIAFYILLSVFIIQVFYYLFVFSRLAFLSRKKKNTSSFPPVSVIICARNELINLEQFLPSILEQDYSEFQVVVVNDCSWDETEHYLREMEKKYAHLKIVTIKEQEKYRHSKKFAVALGIKGAKYDWLLHTDADCKPAGKDWIKGMAKGFTGKTELVIGYGAYQKQNGLLNKWIRFDAAFTAVQYLSWALSGKAYMGTGRNLAYTKALFFRNKGFANHYHIQSGDDDLFVNETSVRSNTATIIDPETFTYSLPKKTFREWWKQKKRHLTTGKHYKPMHKFWLGLYFLSLFLFHTSLILLLIVNFQVKIAVTMLVIRLAMQMIVLGKSFAKLLENDLVWYIPFFDLFITLIYPPITFITAFNKNKSWK